MRKTLILSLVLSAAMTMRVYSNELKMMIVSDVHIFAPELLVSEGEAFEAYLHNDRKMLKESPALLKKVTEEILRVKPKFVLMPGDLTKDGELLSHQYLKTHCLDPLLEAGIKTYVIPGNHDINNPDGVEFLGKEKRRVETLQKHNFAEFYHDYGYGEAFDHDSVSLSYALNLSDSVVLLALDGNLYEKNNFEKGICRHEGTLKEETIEWATNHIKTATKNGQRVIAMMHHGLIKHWKYQDEIMPGYLIENNKKIANKFRKAGLEIIFTGHYHAQDVAKMGKLYDIQTGSMVSFPAPYRVATLKGRTLTINSFLLDNIDYDLGSSTLYQHSEKITQQGIASYLENFFPENIPSEVLEEVLDAISIYASINYRGDERITPEMKAEIKQLAKKLRPYSFKWSIIFSKCAKALLDNHGVADNDLVISF